MRTERQHPPGVLCGLVLAGGRSSRMGSDKALLPGGGEPWWAQRRRALLAAGADWVWVSRRPGQAPLPGASCIHDRTTIDCPLSGVWTALACGAAGHLAVLAVDMPLAGPEWLRALLAQCGPSSGAAFVHDGLVEPLAAVYPGAALAALGAALEEGNLSLQSLTRRLEAAGLLRLVPLPPGLAPGTANLNSPAELRAAPLSPLPR